MAIPEVLIFDTTLRDGEQAPGNSLSPEEKLRVARQLDALGVDIIEAGFPAASESDYRSIREIRSRGTKPGHRGTGALCRARYRAGGRGAERGGTWPLHVFVSTSDLHIREKLRTTREGVLAMTREAVRRARQYTDDVEFSAEDASRTDADFLCQWWRRPLRGGGDDQPAGHSGLRDAVRVRGHVQGYSRAGAGSDRMVLSAHCHDDLGLAMANTLAAIAAGAAQVECTINGIGERAGNAALEEIVMASRVRGAAVAFQCKVESREIYRTSQLLSYLTGVLSPAEQGHRGSQCVCARSRDPSAWHAPERPHL